MSESDDYLKSRPPLTKGEFDWIRDNRPHLGHALDRLEQGEEIKEGDDLWETYLYARQRGFVSRDIKTGEKGFLTNRADEYREFLKEARSKKSGGQSR